MKVLDICCGLGGWSDGLALEGFDILGIEIVPEVAAQYKHPVIIDDVMNLDPLDYRGYDLIVASPPCRDFSELARLFGKTWTKNPPDPEGKALDLVKYILDFIDVARPTYWILENVPNLEKYLKIPPRTTSWIGTSMKRSFWGNFPAFLIPRDYNKKPFTKRKYIDGKRYPVDLYRGKFAKWERARIPMPLARSLGRCIRAAIQGRGSLVEPIAEFTNKEGSA